MRDSDARVIARARSVNLDGTSSGYRTDQACWSGKPSGILQRAVSSSAALAQTILNNNPASNLPIAALSGVVFSSTFIARLESPTTMVKVRLGFTDDSSASTPNNGIYFETVSGNWTGTAISGGTSSSVTGSAVDTNFHTFEIRNDGSANNITFWMDGNLVGSVASTNVPTVAVQPFFQIQSGNTSDKTLDIDAFQLTMTVLR